MPTTPADLNPDGYYWVRREGGGKPEIVQISTVFGNQPEFYTVAVMGSEEHHDLHKFEFLAEIPIRVSFTSSSQQAS